MNWKKMGIEILMERERKRVEENKEGVRERARKRNGSEGERGN